MFETIQEGIIKIMEERFRFYRAKMSAEQYGARTLTFKDFLGCGAPEFFEGEKPPIAARQWIENMGSFDKHTFQI